MTDDSSKKPLVDLNEIGAGLQPSAALSWLDENWKLIAGVAVAAVVLTAGWSMVESFRDRQVSDAKAELGKALVKKAGPERIKAIEDFVAAAPSGLKTAALIELAKAQTEAGEQAAAAATWDRLAQSGKPELAPVAALGKASALLASGKADEALAVLETLRTSAGEEYRQVIDRQIALAAERAGKPDRALTALEAVKAGPPTFDSAWIDSRIAAIRASGAAKTAKQGS
jgi:predicted negative regulator of RcsB-dependent stress response